MYNHATYVAPLQNIMLLEETSHVDSIKIPDNTEGPVPLKKIEYLDDGTMTVIFGGGTSPVYPDIPNFTYVHNFQVNQTFAFRCIEKNDYTFLGFYKYLGTTTIFDDAYLLLWHVEGETPKPIPCNYPEIIVNSIDVLDVEPRKNYLEEVHRQFGLST